MFRTFSISQISIAKPIFSYAMAKKTAVVIPTVAYYNISTASFPSLNSRSSMERLGRKPCLWRNT